MASEALPTLIVRMAPPADTWPEIAVEIRSWREEVVLATKGAVLFLTLLGQLLSAYFCVRHV